MHGSPKKNVIAVCFLCHPPTLTTYAFNQCWQKLNEQPGVFHFAPGSPAGRGFPGPSLHSPSGSAPGLWLRRCSFRETSDRNCTPPFTQHLSAQRSPALASPRTPSPLNPDPRPALQPEAPPPPQLPHRVRSNPRSSRPCDTHSLPAPPARTPSHHPSSPHPGPPPTGPPLGSPSRAPPRPDADVAGLGASSRFPSASLLLSPPLRDQAGART